MEEKLSMREKIITPILKKFKKNPTGSLSVQRQKINTTTKKENAPEKSNFFAKDKEKLSILM